MLKITVKLGYSREKTVTPFRLFNNFWSSNGFSRFAPKLSGLAFFSRWHPGILLHLKLKDTLFKPLRFPWKREILTVELFDMNISERYLNDATIVCKGILFWFLFRKWRHRKFFKKIVAAFEACQIILENQTFTRR